MRDCSKYFMFDLVGSCETGNEWWLTIMMIIMVKGFVPQVIWLCEPVYTEKAEKGKTFEEYIRRSYHRRHKTKQRKMQMNSCDVKRQNVWRQYFRDKSCVTVTKVVCLSTLHGSWKQMNCLSLALFYLCVCVWCCSGRLCSAERERGIWVWLKRGTKAKVVIGIINTHFSIYPSNEAFLFIPSGRFIRNTASIWRKSQSFAACTSAYIIVAPRTTTKTEHTVCSINRQRCSYTVIPEG